MQRYINSAMEEVTIMLRSFDSSLMLESGTLLSALEQLILLYWECFYHFFPAAVLCVDRPQL